MQSGIELINKTDKIKFQQLLSHIVDNINERTDSGLFTANELVSLEKVLSLDPNQVTLLIKSIRHVIKRMTKFIMRPVFIMNDLTTVLELDEDKAQLFVDKYKLLTKNTADEFSITNLGEIEEVTKTCWQVNLEMASSKNPLERSTSVLVHFNTNKSCDSPVDKHCIEFNIEELKNFHQQIDAIQNEVDSVLNST